MAKVLLVDDDELVRYALGAVLRKAGHEVIEEPNGKKVMAVIAAQSPDIIVTDIIMPEQEGTETIMIVHNEYPDLPIIAMSGGGRNSCEEYLDAAKAFGAVATLNKPFDETVLLSLIKQFSG
ncbi:MAG: response regulator [Rhodospirillales bacterium]|nr:response regulator [Rhodospirillales bacterium]